MNTTTTFAYKREVNKSVLYDGFGIDRNYLPMFLNNIGPLERGESHPVEFVFQGKSYAVTIKNLNNPTDKRKNDAYQVRYTPGGDFAKALQAVFHKTHRFITETKAIKAATGDTSRIVIPEDQREYLAIYSTGKPDVYLCEEILVDEMQALKTMAKGRSEQQFEAVFNYDIKDEKAGIIEHTAITKSRRLNRRIGESLKLLYGYRCQICGQKIGEKYGSNLVEAHHIDYFVKSLNNDASNQMILCPNHHGIIHDRNPEFDRKKLIYKYPNGLKEGLKIDKHLGL